MIQLSRKLLLGLAVGPPLLLAVIGLWHPESLDDASAQTWLDMHVGLLPVFPLLAIAPWLIARRENRRLGWIAAGLGFIYAIFYGALDAVAGIGAGALQLGGATGTDLLFRQGNALAEIGVYAYLMATLVAAGAVVLRRRFAAVPAALITVGAAWSFLDSHIYWPVGGLTMIALAVGWGWLAWESGRSSVASPPAVPAA